MYNITNRQRQIAKNIGVYIFSSDKPKYKIDIYDNEGIYHTSIGDIHYNDYFTYLKSNGKAYADNRRRLYDLRTKKGLSIGSRNWFARRILWDLD
jgi:hypothetical protein